jgi:outer membrane protein OmpA-like peptidoglycan-associated protein
MNENRAKGCLVAAVLWCVILGVLGVAYKFWVHPYLKGRLQGATSSTSPYRDELVVAADSFSGYAVLRSDALKNQLKNLQIKYTVLDDRGDFAARLKALQEGKVQLAAFTIDSLLLAGARLGEFPGTIVLVLDETQGSDAIVAPAGIVNSLQDLNHPDARLVLTPNSPSEFLARVVIAHFNLPNLPEKWWIDASGAKAAFQQLRAAKPGERRAYVLWEPYIAKALEQTGVHVLLDSAKLKGYIVDVLVAQRRFLSEHPDKVKAFIEAYSRALYTHAQPTNGLVQLVQADARQTGSESLDDAQARQVVQGIWWKNTLENYVHFGLAKPAPGATLEHLEDIVAKIVDVLVKTRALSADPLGGKYNTLYYSQTLAELQREQFHPAKGANVIAGLGPSASDAEQVRTDATLKALSPEQWSRIQPVGELRAEPVVFSRGSATVSVQSERDLAALARRLQSFPNLYLRVIGQTRAEGDPEANRALAQARADSVAQYLRGQGVNPDRIRTEAIPSTVAGGEAQTVLFVVGQLPY